MPKRLLYIADLYDFYSNNYKRSTHFSADKSGAPIVVQVHGKVNFENSSDDTEGLLPVHLQACHTNLNVNGSNINESVMTSALPSFSNRPILGYIHSVDGEWQFYGHNMHEEDGEIVYDEAVIGVIPESCNAQLVYDKEKDKTYCEVDGYIYEEYTKAAEILQREEECSVSVELCIRELSYNAKEKYLDIEDFWFSGVTILGVTPDGEDVQPGMQGSNIKLADFSAKNNSLFENKMIELQERLEKLESTCFNKNNQEGGNEANMKFDELLEKYGKTAEDITFDYDGLSNEELEAKFEEEFGEEDTSAEGSTSDDDDPEDEPEAKENEACGGKKKKKKCEKDEVVTRTYELSHDDIRCALYNLLAPYEESDNDYYYIMEVFDTYFVYQGYSGKVYGQRYSKDDDNIAFDGERYELFLEYLTASEKAELADMRSNYETTVNKLNEYEAEKLHAERKAALDDAQFSVIAETDEFKKLYDAMDDYSVADLVKEAKVILADNYSATFAATTKKTPTKVGVSLKPETDAPYGNLFSENK